MIHLIQRGENRKNFEEILGTLPTKFVKGFRHENFCYPSRGLGEFERVDHLMSQDDEIKDLSTLNVTCFIQRHQGMEEHLRMIGYKFDSNFVNHIAKGKQFKFFDSSTLFYLGIKARMVEYRDRNTL